MKSPVEIHHIYTYVDEHTGENTHIDSTALRAYTLKRIAEGSLEILWFPTDRALARKMLQVDKAISLKRCHEIITAGKRFDPIIFCTDGTFSPSNGGPNGMLVDGHHRFFIATTIIGADGLEGVMLPPPEWQPFIMHNLPDLTAQQLIDTPILRRDY